MIIVYIHTGIESVVYDEPWQASNNTTIIDNPSYGVNEGMNQSNKTTVENYMIIIVYIHTGIGSVPLLYEEIMTED